MNVKYPEAMPPEAVQTILSKGGFCHRMPWAAPMPVQGQLGGTDIVIMSGMGMCIKELCPKWTGAKCSEAESSHVERLALAAAAAQPPPPAPGEDAPRIVAP
jgi:hypothetical protein